MATSSSSYCSLVLFLFIVLLLSTVNSSKIHPHHRILHQPFYPIDTSPPPSSSSQPPPPSELPSADSPIPEYQTPPEPKYPFSSLTPPSNPFFPDVPSTPSTPQTPPATSATFPANISSLIFPQSLHKQSASPKYVAIAVILSLFSTAFIISIILLIYKRKHFTSDTKTSRSDSHRLFPTYNPSSNVVEKLPPARTRTVSTTSTEFLYLGTVANAHGLDSDSVHSSNHNNSNNNGGFTGNSSKMSSPELRPLPKLARQNFSREFENVEAGVGVSAGAGGGNEDLDEEFYSPRGSNVEKLDTGSDSRRGFSGQLFDKRRKTSTNSSNLSYPSSNSGSSTSNSPSPPHKSMAAPPPPPPPPPPMIRPMTPSPPKRKPPSPPSPSSPPDRDFAHRNPSPVKVRTNGLFRYPGSVQVQAQAPVPPPPPPPGYWETQISRVQMHEQEMLSRQQPPVLITPSRPVVFQSIAVSPVDVSQKVESVERNEETPRPKLKPLHWDKVRASSDKTMVWDQLRSSSFQLNEEMIESLFIVNNNGNTNVREGGGVRPGGLPSPNQENRVLDPKKSQNISILLRALNVTIEEVCEALLEGNTDTLGTDLLESLLKMAPSKEEERKLKEYKDDSPFKLGTAERFLKALVDVPFAFKRVAAMLYIANFDSEVEYLRKSFITLEAACEELRNSRMFLKLLEAVLKTGNRMNVGTNRGDAHAFKLDTLLKLVDVKGTDGKTTLLHFVKTDIHNDVEFRKRGLEVVSSISGELANVKKSATMDSDVLSSDVSKLARGLSNIGEVMRLNESTESMNSFMKKAELEIIRIQAQESVALSVVKEITEIFLVVRDFLSVLDRVCKEVGKINERTIVSSARQFPVPVNPTQPTVFPVFPVQPQYSSSEDESSSSSS
ncbi:hypothetical protein MKW92_013250 [Papaver armeniacum]|nr:hypothetical protein MKW92_013250 [Papaver armeniacum]